MLEHEGHAVVHGPHRKEGVYHGPTSKQAWGPTGRTSVTADKVMPPPSQGTRAVVLDAAAPQSCTAVEPVTELTDL